MESSNTTDTYTASLEQRLAVLTAERDSLRSTAERLSSERDTLRTEAVCLSQELQGLRSSAARLSSERDALQGVVEKMQCELRELRRMLFGRKSERFIPCDPSQLKLDFEGVAQLQQEREYAALQASAPTVRKQAEPRAAKPAEDRQRRIFSEHLERRDEIVEPDGANASGRKLPNCWNTSLENCTSAV